MEKPNLMTRLRAAARGEISADTLEAYRRASLAVLELLDRTETGRETARALGETAWKVPPGGQAEALCAWNAYVLQNLGTAFLDADYRDDPATKGFVPPITADQVTAFFTPVQGWLGRAQRAAADPHYTLDVPIPADLPAWSDVEPCPNSHLHGMLHAMRDIRERARTAVHFLGDAPPEEDKEAKQFHAIRGLFASAEAKARYADDLHGTNPTQAVHELVEPSIKEAIETFHVVGQLVAMPSLANPIATPPPPPVAPKTPTIPGPGQPGFDPWCLTDPDAADAMRRDREAREAVERLWRYDPDPTATLRLAAEVQAAVVRGEIKPALNSRGMKLGHFFCCPWATVYEVRRPVTLGGTRLKTYDQFVLDVTAEGTELGHPFKRQIKKGSYQPTDKFEYGDPDEAPDH